MKFLFGLIKLVFLVLVFIYLSATTQRLDHRADIVRAAESHDPARP